MKKLWLFLVIFCVKLTAQEQKSVKEDKFPKIKMAARANFWARYYETNPNSTQNGEEIKEISDISIRRLRILLQADLTDKLFFYSNFGNNDINSVTQRNVRFDILDMYIQYEISKKIALGFGEIGWGASRGSMRSSKSMMGLDTPLFSLFNVNKNDDLARNLGAFAKGELGKFQYVATIKNPLKQTIKATEGKVDYASNATRKQYSAYLKYDFWDTESNKTSYSGGAGTYIGAKKLLNIGLGGVFQQKMTSELINSEEKFYDYKNFSAELFLDTPISEKNDAITAYLGYFYTDFGRNFIRNVGANDLADAQGGSTFNGNGNDFPMMGTGHTYFLQMGYLLPKFEKFSPRIQPNISLQYSNFDGLKDKMLVYDLGINLFLKGHDQKLTLSYQNRPIFDKNTEFLTRKGMLVLQFQVEVN